LLDFDTKNLFKVAAQAVIDFKVGNIDMATKVLNVFQYESVQENDYKKYMVAELLGNHLKEAKTRDYKTLLALGMSRKEALEYIEREKQQKGGGVACQMKTLLNI